MAMGQQHSRMGHLCTAPLPHTAQKMERAWILTDLRGAAPCTNLNMAYCMAHDCFAGLRVGSLYAQISSQRFFEPEAQLKKSLGFRQDCILLLHVEY